MDFITYSKLNKFQDTLNSINDILQTNVIRGTATDGMNGFLEDTTKEWTENEHSGRTIQIEINDTYFYPTITSNTSNKVYFNPIQPPTNATVTLGSGIESEGQIELTLIDTLYGNAGNDYSIEIVNGNTDTGMDYITLNSESKLFTIIVDTNGLGEIRPLMAGNIAGAIRDNPEVAAVMTAQLDFTAGNIPLTVEPVEFSGGDDGVKISAGDKYEIAYRLVLENILSRLPE
jgi:hypothetical protein